MGREYRAKVFRSGDALALMLPEALGLKEGAEMRVREDAQGGFTVEPATKEGKIDLTGIAGSIPGLKPLTREDREIEERELDWALKRMRRD
ncbi:MAG: AbrB/MazE/SpoVT family DNA-binding domain-containing protein [Sphingomonas sp.]|uniref:AbrB/MazE/SpoVT family DNA-binding domain-containing protein n=1 Tax=Sphingomonas sp. TaxID=28214 RepID=UPI0025DEFC98|nr:AbrB/MazE/SpoVT family DNA-binding domain-containing protein [Sphingomonas sp.]MBX9882079.1 AbrB/MazE/SpoVT family DNA-binding domain-containing protein [Sphingomonas sp.]